MSAKPARESSDLLRERLDLAFWATNSAIWDWDVENYLIWLSPGIQLLFGRGDEEITEHFDIDFDGDWGTRLHPDDRARVIRALRDHLENDTPYDAEYRYRLPSD
ncbi:MAG: PAS domain-containing protein [Proteobacteria bacterium]|nr:PAS domain-containing protein [Pseudomonadota bacterium]MDA1357711.1 PAS domain-containing protein [Pseudomonadota bacterium]